LKKLVTLIFVLTGIALFGQIPNPDFENWNDSVPVGWTIQSPPGSVTKTAPAYSGNYAVSLNSVASGSGHVGGSIRSAGSSGYFGCNGNFTALTGWYKLNVSNGDELSIIAIGQCFPVTGNGGGAFSSSTTTTVFTQFTMHMYGYSCISDSASILISLTNPGSSTNAGSFAVIDDLALTFPAGINEISNDVTLEKAYPNPANKVSNIIYSIPADAFVSLSLYDVSGRLVQQLLNDTKQTRGRYKIPVDVNNLPGGIYIYQIMVNGQAYSQKLVVY
jgi:hypothetical protein